MSRKSQIILYGLLIVSFIFLFFQMDSVEGSNRPGESERVIKITAQKFHYTPNKIVLKKNQPVVLVIRSKDRLHGFHIEEMGIRKDIEPGEAIRVSFTPEKAGEFTFQCDIFCGGGHGEMSGTMIVK